MMLWRIINRVRGRDSARPALMVVQLAENRARCKDLLVELYLFGAIVALVASLVFAIKAGAFDWRPGDQAVSTIDYRLAPHLEPLKGVSK